MTASFQFLVALLLIIPILISRYVSAEIDTIPRSFGNYSETERTGLDELRTSMGSELYRDFMKTDQFLIRWLRNQDFDIGRAQTKLHSMLKWRVKHGIDEILKEDFSKWLRLCPYDVSARDRIGRPILTAAIGGCNLRRVALLDYGLVRRLIYYNIEKAAMDVHDLQVKGENLTDFLMLGNAAGFNSREHMCLSCLPAFAEMFKIYENYYPNYFYRILIINTPRVADVFLSFIKPLMSERTRSVLNVYGLDKRDWEPVINELISPDQLDITFGGTKRPNHNPPSDSNNLKKRSDESPTS